MQKKNLAAAAHVKNCVRVCRFRQHGQPQAQRRIRRSRLCCRRHAECAVTFLCNAFLVPSMKHAKCAYSTGLLPPACSAAVRAGHEQFGPHRRNFITAGGTLPALIYHTPAATSDGVGKEIESFWYIYFCTACLRGSTSIAIFWAV